MTFQIKNKWYYIYVYRLMGTNSQLVPLTDNTDGAVVDQVQQ